MTDVSHELRMFIVNAGSHTVLEMGGELDLASADMFRDRLQVATDVGTGDVLLDMSRVSFCDAGTLNAVVAAHRSLEPGGRSLHIVRPSACVERILRICELDRLIGFGLTGLAPSGLRPSGLRLSGLRLSGLRLSGLRLSGLRAAVGPFDRPRRRRRRACG